MKTKTFFLLTVLLVLCTLSQAQTLKFRNDGKFKIVQFTDIHYKVGEPGSARSISMIEATLEAEKPDLVVFTGDIVVKAPTKQGWDEVLATVIKRNIPYLVTFGNHDDESEMKRQEVAGYVVSKSGILQKNAKVEGVEGFLNQAVTILDRSGKAGAIIYAMDSRAYSTNERVKGYGWFDHSQVNWFVRTSAGFRQQYGQPLPALAFFHIPLPEYKTAFDQMGNKRLGVRYENECAPEINTGMFAAMFESGDVMGTFVGHDHVNDYLVDYHGIALAYGCFSGSENTYQRNKNGARVIELEAGVRTFRTWIREFDGTVMYALSYPFPAKK